MASVNSIFGLVWEVAMRKLQVVVVNRSLAGMLSCFVVNATHSKQFLMVNELKTIFAYDTFDGMSSPQDIDITHNGTSAQLLMKMTEKKDGKNDIHCFSSLDLVKKNILEYSNLSNIKFIKGEVEKTLSFEKNLPKKISILRLDTDFYSSTRKELEILYPRLVSGGILIIDDYGFWRGARQAVDEYFNKPKWLHIVDQTCRYLIKD